MTSPQSLALAPDLPLVWETPHTLRIGLEQPLARLVNVTAAEQKLLSALSRGIPSGHLNEVARKAGLTAAGRDTLLERIHAALTSAPLFPSIRAQSTPHACIITGDGWASPEWVRIFAAALRTTGVHSTVTPAAELAEMGLPFSGAPSPAAALSADLLILPERYAVPRTKSAPWLALGIPALSIRLRDRATLIGPIIDSSGTPCLDCCNAAETLRDPAWPLVTAQLLGTRPPSETPAIALIVAAYAASFILQPRSAGQQLRVTTRLGLPHSGVEQLVVQRRSNCACAKLHEA